MNLPEPHLTLRTYIKDPKKYVFLHFNLLESYFWFLLPLESVTHCFPCFSHGL